MTTTLSRSRGLAATIGRVILGIVFVAHGWQKFDTYGISGVQASFAKMGIPAPHISAWFASLAELVGGVFLIVGVGIPVVALVLIIDMLGAIVTVDYKHGLLGGYELPLVLIAGLISVAVADHGRLAVDSQVRARFGKGVNA